MSNLLEKKSNKTPNVPDKFWDEEKQAIKIDELLEDYNSLVARDTNLVENNNRNMPENYEAYEINIPHPLLERDDDVLKRFYEKGFTNDQAQFVYDLANERVIPYLNDMAGEFESEKQREELISFFGGEERFNEASRSISNWAKQNLRAEVYDALAVTADGVIALYKMMSSNEPGISKERDVSEELSEDKLKQMMQDPKYWRERNKEYVAKVANGFKKLYPEK